MHAHDTDWPTALQQFRSTQKFVLVTRAMLRYISIFHSKLNTFSPQAKNMNSVKCGLTENCIILGVLLIK